MIIFELPDDEKIVFEFSFNNHKFEFPSKVLGRGNGYLLAEPIHIGGKILSFNSEQSIAINLIYNRDNKSPVIWKGIGVSIVVVKGKQQYKVVSSGEGYEINRRDSFRLFLGVNGVAQINVNKKALNVIVKDISETGFSFVSAEDIERVEGLPVRLVFADMNKQFSLMGQCVRKVKLAEDKFLYGCQLTVENTEIPKYINEKQRQMLSVNRGNAAARNKEMLEQALKEPSKRDDVSEADLKKMVPSGNSESKRKIDTVGKVERRDIFKDKFDGKRV
ncbi:MAG: PilZ domain-containing protein [Lachnospira sp.]